MYELLDKEGHMPLGVYCHGRINHVFLMQSGNRRKRCIVSGDVIVMWEDEGRRCVDAASRPVANKLGDDSRQALGAMQRGCGCVKSMHPTMFESGANADLFGLFPSITGGVLETAYVVSGGSKASETAIKLARLDDLTQGLEIAGAPE